MLQMKAKNKIFLALVLWIGLSATIFFYFFDILDQANQKTLNAMAQQRKDLANLKAERESYRLAKEDLDDLAKRAYQPMDFFSKDISLVKEIKTLEALGEQMNVTLQLSGVSGTTATAAKAKTITPLAVIPYSIYLTGQLEQVVKFIEAVENLSFVTKTDTLSINAGENGNVSAVLAASFYIKK